MKYMVRPPTSAISAPTIHHEFGPMISLGVNWRLLWMTAAWFETTGTWPGLGANIRKAKMQTITPCPSPKLKNADWKPLFLIIEMIGTTVRAEPAPKPAAVIPAAKPRRPGNHFSALPMQVP